MLRFVLTLAAGLATAAPGYAITFGIMDERSSVIGHNMVVYSRSEDTLLDIARSFDLGYGDIVSANPDVDAWVPGDNTRVVLPTRFILPDGPREGIVINLAELRLYYYPKRSGGSPQRVITHPIGIGREGWSTPLGNFRITEKRKDPTWTPPASIRKEYEKRGEILPAVVQPGPDNPLGGYAMRLSNPSYLLHGTNKPYGVGMRVSSGCIRLFPEDIEHLYQITPPSTPVEIVYQPNKAGQRNGHLYLEAHKPLEDMDERDGNNMTPMVSAILRVNDRLPVDDHWRFVESLVRDNHGVVKRLDEQELDIVDELWFVHAGYRREAIRKTRDALSRLNMDDLFWPISAGAVGEVLVGPFTSHEQADKVAEQLSAEAGTPVWTVQVSSDAL